METLKKLCIGMLLIEGLLLAQAPDTLWTKTYGGESTETGTSLQQTSDGGYIIAGYTGLPDDVWLLKTDANGDTLWTKTYGGENREWGNSVHQTSDGGYIIAGMTESYGAGSRDVYLIKTDANGDTLWTKTYGGESDDLGYSVEQASDEGYIIAGMTESYGAGSRDVYLIKTDANGDTLWTKTYGGANQDAGHSVHQTSDGGYIIAGFTRSFGAGDYDVWLLKTDANGDTLWTKTYGGANRDAGNSIQQTSDGGYIIAGMTESYGAGNDDVYLIKTDANGDTLWTKTYGESNPNERGFSVQQTTDSGYIIAGTMWIFGSLPNDVYLIKTDSNGDMLWTRTYGGASGDAGNSVQQTMDGGYSVVGVITTYRNGDIYFIRLTPDSLLTDDPSSLAYNGNRHLVRKPNSEILHIVYTMEGHIIYTRSPDGGTSWSALRNLGQGEFPAIALDSDNLPSVAWTDEEGGLWYRRKTSVDDWSDIYHLDNPTGPSDRHLNSPPAIAIHPSSPNTAHILVTRSGLVPEYKYEYSHTLADFAFPINDPGQGWFNIIEEKLGPLEPPLRSFPSIAPCEVNNSLHATWQRVDTICYATKPRNDPWNNWGDAFYPQGHQSVHPFVETYGDSIFVVWQKEADENVYRAYRHLSDSLFQRENFSRTPVSSNYPVNASGFFTVYAEEPTANSPYDVYYKVSPYDDRINVSSTSYNSLYPQSAARFAIYPYLYTTWLEGDDAPYEIGFRKIQHLDPEDKAYLSSVNGQSLSSPYLVARDGFVDGWQIPVDIGNMATTYQFPLVPGYAYKTKAVVYHEASGPWSGRIEIDNNLQFIITYNANVPETLECWIPPALYEDSVLTVSFNCITGDFAAVGPIYIYRYEYDGGGGPMSQQSQPTHSSLITVFPNPFTERLSIAYQATSQSKAELKVYDVTGRLVKQFTSPSRESLNQIIWDGTDDRGRAVPQGVYFLRVDNPYSGDILCQKVLKVK